MNLKHPKRRISIALRTTEEQLFTQVSQLTKELTKIKVIIEHADRKVKALTLFASHQDNAVTLLGTKFTDLKAASMNDTLTEEVLANIETDLNGILDKSDEAVSI